MSSSYVFRVHTFFEFIRFRVPTFRETHSLSLFKPCCCSIFKNATTIGRCHQTNVTSPGFNSTQHTVLNFNRSSYGFQKVLDSAQRVPVVNSTVFVYGFHKKMPGGGSAFGVEMFGAAAGADGVGLSFCFSPAGRGLESGRSWVRFLVCVFFF